MFALNIEIASILLAGIVLVVMISDCQGFKIFEVLSQRSWVKIEQRPTNPFPLLAAISKLFSWSPLELKKSR